MIGRRWPRRTERHSETFGPRRRWSRCGASFRPPCSWRSRRTRSLPPEPDGLPLGDRPQDEETIPVVARIDVEVRGTPGDSLPEPRGPHLARLEVAVALIAPRDQGVPPVARVLH